MATERQIAANRRNAQKATGPRSAAGKAISSRNATRHGLTALTHAVLPPDKAAFERFMAELAADSALCSHSPAAVRRAALDLWQLQRVIPQLETNLLDHEDGARRRCRGLGPHFRAPASSVDAVTRCLRNLNRYESAAVRRLMRFLIQEDGRQHPDHRAAAAEPHAELIGPL